MSHPKVHPYTVDFSVSNGTANWAYTPSIPDCRLNVKKRDRWTVFAFNIQPMATTFWPAQFTTIKWNTQNNSQPDNITVFTPESADNQRMLLILDKNDEDSSGSYSFQLQVLYGGVTYTAPDPIIVNKDTTGGDDPAVTSEIQEPVEAG